MWFLSPVADKKSIVPGENKECSKRSCFVILRVGKMLWNLNLLCELRKWARHVAVWWIVSWRNFRLFKKFRVFQNSWFVEQMQKRSCTILSRGDDDASKSKSPNFQDCQTFWNGSFYCEIWAPFLALWHIWEPTEKFCNVIVSRVHWVLEIVPRNHLAKNLGISTLRCCPKLN